MTASAVAGLLQKAGSVIIASHRDPDGDALGATLGLMHLLKRRGQERYGLQRRALARGIRLFAGRG